MTTIQPFLNWWLLGTAFFFVISWTFSSGVIRGLQSRGWPTTPGRVVESTVRENGGSSDEGSTFEPVVRYAYEVDGRPQESKQVTFMTVAASEAGARSVTSRYPLGREVTVHHHPQLHHLAVLEPGHFVGPLLAAIVSGAAFVFVAWNWWHRSTTP